MSMDQVCRSWQWKGLCPDIAWRTRRFSVITWAGHSGWRAWPYVGDDL